jgi:YebC/PmpR family DNA-binding regulatory protein
MPAENIKRAIRRGTGEEPGVQYEEITYEGYGPGGVALIIETMTDNKNRTVGEIRHILTKYGGDLGQSNSVSWKFEKKGYIVIEKAKASEDALMSAALDAGADDLRDDGENWEVISAPESFPTVKEAIDKLGITPESAQVAQLPKNYVSLEGKAAQSMLKLLDLLEDHDDVQHVWSDMDVDEKELEAFA